MSDRRSGEGSGDRAGGIHDGYLVVGVALAAVGVGAGVVVGGGSAWGVALGVLGALAVALGVRSFVGRARSPPGRVSTGDVERGSTAPTPGEGFDRALATFEDEGAEYLASPDRVRRALTNAGVDVLGRYRGLPPEEARRRIRTGDWTGDPEAAAFLGGTDGSAPSPGLAGRLRRILGRESAFGRGTRRTVAAIADVAGVDRVPMDGGSTNWSGNDDGGAGDSATDTAGDSRRSAPTETRRWRGIGGLVLVSAGLGVLGNWPAVALAGTVGAGVAAYARTVGPPDATLSADRSVSTTDPGPGAAVEVTVELRNDGERTIPDLRVVDGVPPALPVVAGTPRAGTSLRPGETLELSYELRGRRGVHEFGPLRAIVADLAGTAERTIEVEAPGVERPGSPEAADRGTAATTTDGGTAPATITCRPPLSAGPGETPIDGAAARYSGRVASTVAGEGVEFHAVREYQRSDPIGRIDWKRYARTRTLAAREFRDERATTAVVVVDARRAAYLAPNSDRPHAVDRGVLAANRAFSDLEGAGNRVGIAVLGRRTGWLAPGTGSAHRARARDLLATHPGLSSTPPEDAGSGAEGSPVAWLRSRLPADAQVVFVSPVCDDDASETVRRLRAHGYPVTVVSPDPTATRTPGQLLARVGRRLRLARLRDAGATVVDWTDDEPLAAALRR